MLNDESWLGVTHERALRFFFERLKDVAGDPTPAENELLYNASVLAHFATTSTASSTDFPPCPSSLTAVFDLYVLDRSQHADPKIMEAAGSQCLLLTGFFRRQHQRRYNVEWFAGLGAAFYGSAAHLSRDASRTRLLEKMAERFGFWRLQHGRLAVELRDEAHLLRGQRPDAAAM
jgi:hypothetical protein